MPYIITNISDFWRISRCFCCGQTPTTRMCGQKLRITLKMCGRLKNALCVLPLPAKNLTLMLRFLYITALCLVSYVNVCVCVCLYTRQYMHICGWISIRCQDSSTYRHYVWYHMYTCVCVCVCLYTCRYIYINMGGYAYDVKLSST